MKIRCADLLRRDRGCDAVAQFASRLRRSPACRNDEASPANLFPAIAFRAQPPDETRGGGDRKNVCNQQNRRRRTFRRSAATRGSAKYETAGDRPLPLPFRANSIARAKQWTRDRAAHRLPKFAMLHGRRARDRSPLAQARADTIAGTTPFDFAIPFRLPNVRSAAIDSGYR